MLAVSPSDNALTESEGAPEATIAIDGGEPLLLTGPSVTAEAGTYAFTLNADFIGNGLIDGLKNGTTAKINFKRGDKTAAADLPLAGAAASLLFIDEYQDRIGHTDAMSAKGDKAPNPPLPVTDITSIADLPEAIRTHFAEGGSCADTDPACSTAMRFRMQPMKTRRSTSCPAAPAALTTSPMPPMSTVLA